MDKILCAYRLSSFPVSLLCASINGIQEKNHVSYLTFVVALNSFETGLYIIFFMVLSNN